MAYQTGTGNTCGDFVDALRAFCLGLGWTIVKHTASANTPLLFLEKGNAHVTMQGFSVSRTRYTGTTSGTSQSFNDIELRMACSGSINAASNNYWGHPNSGVVDADGSASYPPTKIRGMIGPFVAWHFFSNATGDWIHAVIQITADLFMHMSFGLVDKLDLTHSGVAFATASNNVWWRDYYDESNANSTYNRPSDKTIPQFMNSGASYYAPNALPAGFVVFGRRQSSSSTTHGDILMVGQTYNSPSHYYNAVTTGTLQAGIILAPAQTWNGAALMGGIPFVIGNVSAGTCCAVGAMGDVRVVNMEGLIAGQEITLGSDVWKIFPVLRQQPWGVNTAPLAGASSGQYGIAYKKVT